LQSEQIVAPHAHRPGGSEVSKHAAGELEAGVGRIVGGGLVLPPVLVPAIWNMSRAHAAHGPHLAEEVVENVAPVAQHVEDDAAAVSLAVVPGGTLRRNPVAFEDPVAEFTANGNDLAEEAVVAQF